jgi:uncharacterized protein YcsI (UPF0317 family)
MTTPAEGASAGRPLTRADLATATGAEVRRAVRDGLWSRATHGLARGFIQANLAIVRARDAADFRAFCERNPQPCPIIDVTAAGDPEAGRAAPGSDVRIDLPGYRLYRDGNLAGEARDLRALWRDDHVAFLLGCSNSMDEVLEAAGIPQRHLATENGRISVYVSNIACTPAGRFHGPMVVTMRPIARDKAAQTAALTARYPLAHGAPVHVGDPRAIGIADLERDIRWGAYNAPGPDDATMFWACGVTPQAIAMACRIGEMITHAAGHMFVSDLELRQTEAPAGRVTACC